MDEPAAGLDPAGRKSILDGIKKYQRESATTVVIVSHSMEDMAAYCDGIAVMSKGKTVMYGTPPEVFSRAEELTATGLDVPLVTKVALELEKCGIRIGKDVYTVKYAAEKLLERGCAL